MIGYLVQLQLGFYKWSLVYSQQKPGRQHWDRSICRPALQSGHSSEGIELNCVEKVSITVTLQLQKKHPYNILLHMISSK